MRHAFLVPLVLAAAAPTAGAAIQDRDACIRVVTLEDGARVRLGFNVPLPDPSATGVGRPFSVWIDGAPLPEVPSDRPLHVAIDFDEPRMRETRSAMLDSAALLDTLRAAPVFEIGSDPVIVLPIRDGASIAREMERCLAAAPPVSGGFDDATCRHSIALADGELIRFDFGHRRRQRVGVPAGAPEYFQIEVGIDGSPLPIAGSRVARIVLAKPEFARSSSVLADFDPLLAALQSGATIELRGAPDRVLHSIAFPERAQAARQAEQCRDPAGEAGRRR